MIIYIPSSSFILKLGVVGALVVAAVCIVLEKIKLQYYGKKCVSW